MSEANKKPDPLRVLSLAEVVRRTGYSRDVIMRSLAEDRINNAPGANFPLPMQARGRNNRLEWREATLLTWFAKREQMA